MIISCLETNTNLPTIVLMSHGYFAKELIESAKLIAGKNVENVGYVCLEEGDDPQEFMEEVAKTLNNLGENKIVLVDLLGGTPCNSFVRATNLLDKKCNAISGMNLPMLLELISTRENMNVTQLGELAESIGKESVCNITERLIGIKY